MILQIIAVQLLLPSGSPRRTTNDHRKTVYLTRLRAVESTTEYRSFIRVDEGILARKLAFDCGHSYTQEECAMKTERDDGNSYYHAS